LPDSNRCCRRERARNDRDPAAEWVQITLVASSRNQALLVAYQSKRGSPAAPFGCPMPLLGSAAGSRVNSLHGPAPVFLLYPSTRHAARTSWSDLLSSSNRTGRSSGAEKANVDVAIYFLTQALRLQLAAGKSVAQFGYRLLARPTSTTFHTVIAWLRPFSATSPNHLSATLRRESTDANARDCFLSSWLIDLP